MQDCEAAISARAYQLWEESGHAHGRHEQHWHQAGREHDETEACSAAIEQFSSEAAEAMPAKPTKKRSAKAAEPANDVTPAPTKKPRISTKSAASAALN